MREAAKGERILSPMTDLDGCRIFGSACLRGIKGQRNPQALSDTLQILPADFSLCPLIL